MRQAHVIAMRTTAAEVHHLLHVARLLRRRTQLLWPLGVRRCPVRLLLCRSPKHHQLLLRRAAHVHIRVWPRLQMAAGIAGATVARTAVRTIRAHMLCPVRLLLICLLLPL
jgi:hypothetical protein